MSMPYSAYSDLGRQRDHQPWLLRTDMAETSLHLLQGCHLGLLHDSSEILLCLLQRSDWGVLLWHA